jgi:hypothetical protein
VADENLIDPPAGRFDRESMMQTYPLIRGCYRDCRFCGGSRYAYRTHFHRPAPASLGIRHFRDCLREMAACGARVLKLNGDTRAFGKRYDAEMRAAVREAEVEFDAALEVFDLPTRDYLEAWREVVNNFVLILSPESTFAALREIHGKRYSNEDILRVGDWCDELGIHLVFSLMYPLPGHTRDTIVEELDFFEEVLARYPRASMMFQPYLFIDPGCEIFDHPEEYGATVRFATLRDIVAGLTRPHWYHAIGYEYDTLSRDDFCATILEVSARKAALYHEHGRLSAVNLVKTAENVALHARTIDYIRRADPADQELDRFIRRTFPAYLRQSNTNLIQRPFTGYVVQDRYDLSAAVFEAFPGALELLLRHGIVAVEGLVERVRKFRESGPSTDEPARLGVAYRGLYSELLGDAGWRAAFFDDLLAFEWLVYGYFYRGGERLADATDLESPYDFDSLDGFLGGVTAAGNTLWLPRRATRYRFTREGLVSESADGRRAVNVFARKTYRLDRAVKPLLKTQYGIDCDQDYVELGAGD